MAAQNGNPSSAPEDHRTPEGAANSELELANRVAELVSELAEAKERLLRALAEQENVRRRAQRQVEEGTKHAVADFARDLLSTVDNLSRAAASMPDVKPADGALLQVLTGISATERGLIETLEKHGIRRIDPLGAPFDPHLHEAMFEVANPMQAPGTVVEVLQPGYIQHDRLLRPAMVGVVARPREPA